MQARLMQKWRQIIENRSSLHGPLFYVRIYGQRQVERHAKCRDELTISGKSLFK